MVSFQCAVRIRRGSRAIPRTLAVLALLGQLVASVGLPVPVALAHNSSIPYPCQGRKCGCKTSEACWAGACCCFTMKEKITWAEANGVNAPAHSRAVADAEQPKDDSCAKQSCCPPKIASRWSSGFSPSSMGDENGLKPELQQSTFHWMNAIDVQGCHGKPADAMGVMHMPPAVVGKFVTLWADLAPAFDWLKPFDIPVPSRTSDISTPPPKLG